MQRHLFVSVAATNRESFGQHMCLAIGQSFSILSLSSFCCCSRFHPMFGKQWLAAYYNYSYYWPAILISHD